MDNLSPIVLFVYNRLEHTKKTIQALKKNKLANKSQLYIFSDGPKNKKVSSKVNQVRKLIKKIDGFADLKIIERERNLGLAESIITGVTGVIDQHKKVIVLEDDIVTSPAFLIYMNKLLALHERQDQVFSITGYNHPERIMKIPAGYQYDIYFHPRAASWSWGTWKSRWDQADWEVKDFKKFKKDKHTQKKFNQGGNDMSRMLIRQMEGKLDSWAIRWCYTLFKNNGYCIYPVKSYVDNIGLDQSGQHCGQTNKYHHKSLNKKVNLNLPENGHVFTNKQIFKNFRRVYKKNWKTYFKILFNKIMK